MSKRTAFLVLALCTCVAVAVESGLDMPNERWVRPVVVDSLSDVVTADMPDAAGSAVAYPHPASPKQHIQPVYEQDPRPAKGKRARVVHPNDGTPFIPVYRTERVKQWNEPEPPQRPTVLSPFEKPERVVGSHFPPIPDVPCACAFKVTDLRLCTKWVVAPAYECIRGTEEKCFKYAKAPVRHLCPCLHADNHRKCYALAPPGTRDPRSIEELQRANANAASAAAAASAASSAKPAQPQPQPQQPQPQSKATPTPMIVSPTPFQPTQPSTQPQAKATDPKQFMRDARVAAVKAAADAKLTAYRNAAIARYQRKAAAQRADAQRQRKARIAVKLQAQARAKGLDIGAGASPVSAVSGNTAFSLSPNGNARPHQRLVLVAATDFDKDVMTRTLYGEAKHEDEPGQRAVAWSLINRARDPKHRFPKTIADVCKQSGQFRTWAKPTLTREATRLSRHSAEYKAMRAVVEAALAGQSLDPTEGGQYYYYNGRVPPQWSANMACTFRSKVHTFCHSQS